MPSVCRANSLGPEGGASLAAGLARNCGTLKELVVADNRMGPGVATLVAATMHGRTPQCLRGFGYRAVPKEFQQQKKHQDGRSSEVGGDFGGNAAPPFEKGGQRSALSPSEKHCDSGAEETPSRRTFPTGKRSSHANSGDTQPLSLTPVRQSLSGGLQRTSAVASPPPRGNCSTLSTSTGAAGEGVVGSGGSQSQLLSISDPPTIATAAIEEDLGRPQTAGTASG